jgi:predicted O-methyltransferase YrrM
MDHFYSTASKGKKHQLSYNRPVKHTPDAIVHADQAAYLARIEPPRDALLSEMERYAAAHHHPISDPEVATFLHLVCRTLRPARVVELGTNIGYGAIVLARGAPEARVVTIERAGDLCDVARRYIERAGLSDRVEVVHGTAIEELDRCAPGVDLFYVDCVKEEYPAYLERIIPRLSSRGVIVADNVLWRGLVARDEVPEAERARVTALRRFNDMITTHPELRGLVLPLGDGVAFAARR